MGAQQSQGMLPGALPLTRELQCRHDQHCIVGRRCMLLAAMVQASAMFLAPQTSTSMSRHGTRGARIHPCQASAEHADGLTIKTACSELPCG